MNILSRNSVHSAVYWEHTSHQRREQQITSLITKDGYIPLSLRIGKESKHQVQDYCHELGHLIIVDEFDMNRYRKDRNYKIRIELLCHRIGRALCPDSLYSESWAKCGLLGYFNHSGRAVNLGRLRIIPLNYIKGKSIEEVLK